MKITLSKLLTQFHFKCIRIKKYLNGNSVVLNTEKKKDDTTIRECLKHQMGKHYNKIWQNIFIFQFLILLNKL